MRRKDLIGRTIVAVEYPRSWDNERKTWVHYPTATLVFDNGTRLAFNVEETEFGEYGLRLIVVKKKRPAR